MTERTLGDVAAELEGLEGLISMVSILIAPTDVDINRDTPTQETVDRAFYSIGETIRHIRDEVNERDAKYMALSKRVN